MEQTAAAAAASSFSNEEGDYYGEPALGIPPTLRGQHGYHDSFNGDVQPRKLFYNRWSTTLFQCCTHPSACLLACFCPCIAFGRIAEIVDRGKTSCVLGAGLYEMMRFLVGCSCFYSAFFRSKLRAQYRLPDTPAADWAVHFLCEPCALAQEYRELHRRGYDMRIGWQGNLERQRLVATVPPVVAPPMMRQ